MGKPIWISLGSNQGPGRQIFQQALEFLTERAAMKIEALSSLYRTPPWGDTAQPAFLNAVAQATSEWDPDSLLDLLLHTEDRLGRQRGARRWGPRRIDLDLLLYEQVEQQEAHLVLPHPRLHERSFVLLPLAELSPHLQIPGYGSVSACLQGVSTNGIEALTSNWATL